jgi:ABC-type thiamine transport system substrate-binding protein
MTLPFVPTNPPERNSSGGSIVYYIEDTGQIDVEIAYYTSALLAQQLSPDLQIVELPNNLAVKADDGLTILKDADPNTAKLVEYILSPTGQTVLAKYGFGAPSTSVSEPQCIYGIVLVGLIVLLVKKKSASSQKQHLKAL